MITATIDKHGVLIIQPSNELEQYALGKWGTDGLISANILIKPVDLIKPIDNAKVNQCGTRC